MHPSESNARRLRRVGLSLAACWLACGATPCPAAFAGDGASAPLVAAATGSPEELEQAYASAPADVVKGLALADAWIASGKREQALKYFKTRAAERASAGQPADLVLTFLVGRVEGGEAGCAAMWAGVRGRLGRPEGVHTGLPEAFDALAAVEEGQGRIDRAVTALEQRVALAPALGAWLRLGWLRELAGSLATAEQAYRQARGLAPQNSAARNALALVLARQPGKTREARKLVDEGVAKEPASAEAWLYLGLIRSLAGDAPGAVESYNQAFERAQRDPATLTALGAAYGELEQWDLAQKALAAAVALDAERSEAVLQAAAIAVQREQWAEAKKLLAQAGRLTPKSAQVAFLQGVVAQRTQQLDGAMAAYRKAISLEPANAGYALALVAVILERGNLDAAIQVLTQAAKDCPEDAAIQLRLGFVLMQKKRWAQAADGFRAAARLAPKDPDPQLYLAVILGDHLEQLDQARLHLERYKELGGKEPSALAWLAQLSAPAK